MDGKAERRWLGTSPCDNERTIALGENALRAYEGKSSELIPQGPRSRVGTLYCAVLYCNALYFTVLHCTVLHCTVLYRTVLCCSTADTTRTC